MKAARRVGIFGGTFDPPHVGHLAIAECAREQLRLDQVLFVPSAQPPHKRGRVVTDVRARIAMTRLAVRGNPHFRVETLESRRAGPSYTVDTLRELRSAMPGARFWLVVGEDGLREFHTWHDPAGILALATLAVAPRSGTERGRTADDRCIARVEALARRGSTRGKRARIQWLASPTLEVSSKSIRARMHSGCSVRYLVGDAVLRYAERHRLYRRGG